MVAISSALTSFSTDARQMASAHATEYARRSLVVIVRVGAIHMSAQASLALFSNATVISNRANAAFGKRSAGWKWMGLFIVWHSTGREAREEEAIPLAQALAQRR
jgi:hypothetical protein